MVSGSTRHTVHWTLASLVLMLPLPAAASGQDGTASRARKVCAVADSLLVVEDFEGPAVDLGDGSVRSGAWFEGAAGGSTARIENGHLEVNTPPGKAATVWLARELSGNIQIEFDVRVLDDGRTARNMNTLLFFTDRSGRPLYATRSERVSGGYRQLHGGRDPEHNLAGLIITFLSVGELETPRVRLRHVPPFNPVLHEVNGVYHARSDHTYHIRIRRQDSRLQYVIDGNLMFDVDATGLPRKGLFGFRTWNTNLWWDNLKIIQLP